MVILLYMSMLYIYIYIKTGKESQYIVLRPKTGKDPPFGSDLESGRDRNCKLFGRSRRKLWVETLGGGMSNRDGGDGSHRRSVRTCFMKL